MIPLHEQAIRLSPRDPFISNQYIFIGQVHLLQSRGQEAIVWFERERAANPGSKLAHAWLAAAYGLEDDLARAAAEFSEARKLSGGMNYSSIIRIRRGNWGADDSRRYANPFWRNFGFCVDIAGASDVARGFHPVRNPVAPNRD